MQRLGPALAASIDVELMGPLGYTLEQLMELAGLAVAQSIVEEYPAATHRRVLLVCGPGNNGGDGLVAARHLALFGYEPAVVYPKQGGNPFYAALRTQLGSFGVPVSEELPQELAAECDLAVDAIFGFSFEAAEGATRCAAGGSAGRDVAETAAAAVAAGVRAPYDGLLARLRHTSVPVVAVDVPSGWDVNHGDCYGCGVLPSMLVSLTAPKLGTAAFAGTHYVGGRFVPASMATRLGFELPVFAGHSNIAKLA